MKIALIQISSGLDPEKNMAKIQDLIDQILKESREVKAVFLPEVFYSMSDGKKPTPFLIDGENEHYQKIKQLAVSNNIYLIGGTAATRIKNTIVNRSYNFSPTGELIEFYDKKHLFSVNIKSKKKSTIIDESIVYTAGHELKSFELGEFKVALTTCFDLRFPEMYRELFKKGANLFTVASAFTFTTGKAHWETLVRSRAIENQSYVVAANQWGDHEGNTQTYGHSMIVDPWGKVISNCGEGETYKICEIDFGLIEKIRGRMNISPRD